MSAFQSVALTSTSPPETRRDVAEDIDLLTRLRAGDQRAYAMLVSRHGRTMLRVASSFVASQAVAEEAVQDAWLGVIRGVDRFDGRSSLKTWLLRIVVNRAISAGEMERRHESARGVEVPGFSEPEERHSSGASWIEQADERVAAAGLKQTIQSALGDLTALQRRVVGLRYVDCLSSREVCDVLEITQANQRVLLHRGRSRLRRALVAEPGIV